jgi:hypothetical protein
MTPKDDSEATVSSHEGLSLLSTDNILQVWLCVLAVNISRDMEFLSGSYDSEIKIKKFLSIVLHRKKLDWRGKKGGKCLVLGFFFGEKILLAMIRHKFQLCVAYFYVHRRTSSVPPKDTILHYFTLVYTILHYLTLSYTILHYLTLSYTILHYLTLSYTILHYLTLSYTILHYLTLSYTILHYLALSYTILHYLFLTVGGK